MKNNAFSVKRNSFGFVQVPLMMGLAVMALGLFAGIKYVDQRQVVQNQAAGLFSCVQSVYAKGNSDCSGTSVSSFKFSSSTDKSSSCSSNNSFDNRTFKIVCTPPVSAQSVGCNQSCQRTADCQPGLSCSWRVGGRICYSSSLCSGTSQNRFGSNGNISNSGFSITSAELTPSTPVAGQPVTIKVKTSYFGTSDIPAAIISLETTNILRASYEPPYVSGQNEYALTFTPKVAGKEMGEVRILSPDGTKKYASYKISFSVVAGLVTPTPSPVSLKELGFSSVSPINITVKPGSKTQVFRLKSVMSAYFEFSGYPTSYGPGIQLTPSKAYMPVTTDYSIALEVLGSVPPGIYTGKQVVWSDRTKDGQPYAEIPFTVTVSTGPTPTLPDRREPTPTPTDRCTPVDQNSVQSWTQTTDNSQDRSLIIKNWFPINTTVQKDTGYVDAPAVSVSCPSEHVFTNTGRYCVRWDGKKRFVGKTSACYHPDEVAAPTPSSVPRQPTPTKSSYQPSQPTPTFISSSYPTPTPTDRCIPEKKGDKQYWTQSTYNSSNGSYTIKNWFPLGMNIEKSTGFVSGPTKDVTCPQGYEFDNYGRYCQRWDGTKEFTGTTSNCFPEPTEAPFF
ncbi:MAG: hypothetical protein WC686_05160 [Candidatus Shapirobacteria bacterium]